MKEECWRDSPAYDEATADKIVELLGAIGLEPRRRKVRGKDAYRVRFRQPLPSPAKAEGTFEGGSQEDRLYTREDLPETRGRKRDPVTEMAARIPPGRRGPDLIVTREEYQRISTLIGQWRNRPSGKPVHVRLLRELEDGQVVLGFFHVVPSRAP